MTSAPLNPELQGTPAPPNTDGGPQPKNRLASADFALKMISSRATQLQSKWNVWEEIQKKYDCEPPDDPQYLKAHGLGNVTNVCWGTMESRVDEIVETYYNLANGGRTFLKFHTRAQGPQVTRALDILANEHKIMWDSWNGRQELMEQLVMNRSIYPFSAVYYDFPVGWHARALHPRNLIYPARASTDVDSWFWCAVATSFEAWQLLAKLKDADKARDVGWKPDKIRQACEFFCKENASLISSLGTNITWANVGWEQIEQNDLAFNDTIPAFILYVKEWDGKISEHILVNHAQVGYIYSKVAKHERLSEVLRIFPHAIGSGTLDSVRGYGTKTLTYHDALDRLTNAEYDTALITSSLILQADGGTTLDKLSETIINNGGITALPSGFSPAQVNFRDSAAGIRLLHQKLSAQLSRNAPALVGDVEIGEYEKSQREAAMLYQTQLQLGLFKVDRFHEQMNGFGETHWKRLLACLKAQDEDNGVKEAKQFFELVARQGATPDVVASIYRVTHRIGGARGNRVNAQIGMDRARQYIGMFSEEGKRDFAKRDIALSLDSEDEAHAWLGGMGVPDIDSEQANKAMVENGTIAAGQPVVAAGTDVDLIHMGQHTGFVAAEIGRCEQGQLDPRVCLRTIGLAQQHVQPHFQRLAMDKYAVEQTKELMSTWSQFENQRRMLEQQVAKQAEEAQLRQIEAARTPQVDPKDLQKFNAGQMEMAQKDEEHQQRMRHKEQEHSLKMRTEGAKERAEGGREQPEG